MLSAVETVTASGETAVETDKAAGKEDNVSGDAGTAS